MKSTYKAGPPQGNRNAVKHGRYTREQRELARRTRYLLQECEEFLNTNFNKY